jgi:hypothetical protein
MASGIDVITTRVDRHEPRNSTIISAVSAAAMAPSRSTALDRPLDEHRLVEQLVDVHAGGAAGPRRLEVSTTAFTTSRSRRCRS